MPKIEMQLGDEIFSFTSEQHWVNKAQSWFARSSVPKYNYIAVDAAGRVCTKGAEFIRATKENTYPITVYKLLV